MTHNGPRVWHYTIAARLASILADRMIRLESITVAASGDREADHVDRGPGWRPAVWGTLNSVFEPTAVKAIVDSEGWYVRNLTPEEMPDRCDLARIEVEPSALPHNWTAYRRLSGLTASGASLLAEVAKLHGSNLWEWRASFEPVRDDHWIAVEVEKNGVWTPYATNFFDPESLLPRPLK